MITDKDVTKLKKVFATKDELHDVKTELSIVKETVQAMYSLVDGLTKRFDDFFHEYVAINLKGDRHEKWIKFLAEKTHNNLPE